ncbi:CRISPR-associated endoribonuclease Cas2 [compost metagenome]
MDSAQWTFLKQRLCDLIDLEQDSLRFYYLGKHWQEKVEHIGAKAVLDLNGPLIL